MSLEIKLASITKAVSPAKSDYDHIDGSSVDLEQAGPPIRVYAIDGLMQGCRFEGFFSMLARHKRYRLTMSRSRMKAWGPVSGMKI